MSPLPCNGNRRTVFEVTFDALFTDNSAEEIDYLRSFRIAQGHPRITAATIEDDNGTGVIHHDFNLRCGCVHPTRHGGG